MSLVLCIQPVKSPAAFTKKWIELLSNLPGYPLFAPEHPQDGFA